MQKKGICNQAPHRFNFSNDLMEKSGEFGSLRRISISFLVVMRCDLSSLFNKEMSALDAEKTMN